MPVISEGNSKSLYLLATIWKWRGNCQKGKTHKRKHLHQTIHSSEACNIFFLKFPCRPTAVQAAQVVIWVCRGARWAWDSKQRCYTIMPTYSSQIVLMTRWHEFALLSSCSVMSSSFVTPWTVAHQAPLSMRFPWQEYWSGSLFPSPGDLSDPRIEPKSPVLVGRFFTIWATGKPWACSVIWWISLCVLVVFSPCCWVIWCLKIQMVKCLLAIQETWVRSLSQEDPLEKDVATHSSILA